MTIDEAIEIIKDIYNYTKWDTYTTNEARTMAIKALEAQKGISVSEKSCNTCGQKCAIKYHGCSNWIPNKDGKRGQGMTSKYMKPLFIGQFEKDNLETRYNAGVQYKNVWMLTYTTKRVKLVTKKCKAMKNKTKRGEYL